VRAIIARVSASEPPFRWNEATIDPTPPGYVLTVPMNLDERAVGLLEAALPEIPLSGLEYATHAETKRDEFSVEPGKLEISTADFFDMAPEHLKMLLHNAANKARKESSEAQAQDDGMIESFLNGLRESR
jgi:hypothetical protein